MVKKEYGSNFHLESRREYLASGDNGLFSNSNITFYLSGRAGLFYLIVSGVKSKGWKRIYFPSYYCHEVITPLEKLDIDIEFYDFNPFTGELNLTHIIDESDSVFINVNYFNLVMLDDSHFTKLVKIDDLTYNLEGIGQSKADYCFGSLRKELPITVGGFCYSPEDFPIPSVQSTSLALTMHRERLLAMSLKSRYLDLDVGNKNVFLNLFAQTETALEQEASLCGMPKEVVDFFKDLDITKLLSKKSKNISYAHSKLEAHTDVMVNFNLKEGGFGLVFYFDSSSKRDDVREELINNKIYPAILWPLQPSKFAQHIENKVLFVHVDYRYDEKDITTIVNILNQSI